MEYGIFALAASLLPYYLYVRRGSKKSRESSDKSAYLAITAKHEFGLGGVRRYFALDFAFVHLNHASFGCAPFPVMRAARERMLYIESYPDRFMRKSEEGQDMLTAAADTCSAALLGAPAGSCAFVENATAGVNAVLRSLRLRPGDVLVITNHTYNACKNAVLDVTQRSGSLVVIHSVTLPLKRGKSGTGSFEDGLVEAWEETLSSVPPGKLAFCLIDHITSPTAIVMPIGRLAAAAKTRGSLVMIDGAHAPGMIRGLSVASYSADWYVGNLHKWCFTLKGVALLYAGDSVRESVTQGGIISHNWKKSFAERFFMQGTLDYSRYLSAPASIKFVNESLGGWENMQRYNSALVESGACVLESAWGQGRMLEPYETLKLEGITTPFLVVVLTPFNWKHWARMGDGVTGVEGLGESEAEAVLVEDQGIQERVANAVLQNSGVQSVFFTWKVSGEWKICCRIAAQVYNTLEDYTRLAHSVLEVHHSRTALPTNSSSG